MDKEDLVNRLLIVVIIVLTIIVGGALFDAAKKQEDIKHIVNVSNKIIEDIKFMELDIGDVRDGELSKASIVYVNEESKLNVIEDMINKGEKYEFENPVGFDILPTAYLYKENGEVIENQTQLSFADAQKRAEELFKIKNVIHNKGNCSCSSLFVSIDKTRYT